MGRRSHHPARDSIRTARSSDRGWGWRGVLGIALAAATLVVLLRGGSAYWLALPGVVLAAGMSATPAGSVLAGAVVTLAAAAATVIAGGRAVPSPVAAAAVPAGCLVALLAVRTRARRERERLVAVAFTDPLTGVANRRSLLTRAEYEVARHLRDGRSFALVMLDLDGFKALNDRFGHAAGDELLCDVAAALGQAMRRQDTVARFGGDEFCVLAPETDVDGADGLAERIADAVAGATAGVEALRGSVGIAVFPDDGADVARLLHTADQRLMAAKRARPAAPRRRRAA